MLANIHPLQKDAFTNLHPDILSAIASYLTAEDIAITNDSSANGSLYNYVVTCGHLSLIKLIHNKEYHIDLCELSAKYGHLDVLIWAKERGYRITNHQYAANAARYGHFEVLQWLLKNNDDLQRKIIITANEHKINKFICSNAAAGGQLEILQWLYNNGFALNTHVCISAATYGHLNVIQWARANGCPWNYATIAVAARNDHLHILQWVFANECPQRNTYRINYSILNDDILKCLQENGG